MRSLESTIDPGAVLLIDSSVMIAHLEGGESVEDFLEGFPSVKRSQAIAVIEAGQLKMLETVGHAHSH